jgi:hypothetical protein
VLTRQRPFHWYPLGDATIAAGTGSGTSQPDCLVFVLARDGAYAEDA